MKIILQRVASASVKTDNRVVGQIGKGLLLLVGVGQHDTIEDLDYLVNKCVQMRIFQDENNKMNRSLIDEKGEILVISQFTLFGDTRKGRRPSFIQAADPEKGNRFYKLFIERLESYGLKVESGVFGAMMDVESINAGPVTIILDSKADRNL